MNTKKLSISTYKWELFLLFLLWYVYESVCEKKNNGNKGTIYRP